MRLAKLDLLVLDELGYVPMGKAGAELLFDVISTAYERSSVIVTTNLPFEEWKEVLGSERLTGATLDRLTHRCTIIETGRDSYRLREARRRRGRAKPEGRPSAVDDGPIEGQLELTGRHGLRPTRATVSRRRSHPSHFFPGRHPDNVFTHLARDGQGRRDCGDLAGVPWKVSALDQKLRLWRIAAEAAGVATTGETGEPLTLYGLRRDMGADILRLTGSHAESAEVLGHSPEINARHYASFEAERAVALAKAVAERRRESGRAD